MTTYLNIGLARDGQPDLTTVDVADVLAANLIHTYELELQQSETEQTAVITTPLGVGQSVLWDIACRLGQDCIAVHDGHTGLLIGPKAEAWGPFDLSQFLFPKAQQEFTVEAQEAARIAENAKRVRNALATALKESREALGLHGMCSYQREALVIVQNMPDAFLHRVAALLGCD